MDNKEQKAIEALKNLELSEFDIINPTEELGWKPAEGEVFFYPSFRHKYGAFIPVKDTWHSNDMDCLKLYSNGYVFKSEDECLEMCDKLE